ncbi:MAG: hypothetical protein RJA70_3812, partial [Pseudomonadota bacterium]
MSGEFQSVKVPCRTLSRLETSTFCRVQLGDYSLPKRSWIRESRATAILYKLEIDGLDSARSICESKEI